jgi:hypothetical protein
MNAFDDINFDVELVADNEGYKKIKKGEFKIITVEDFCEYMLCQYKRDPIGFSSAMFE